MEYTYEFFEKSAQYVREKLDFQPEIALFWARLWGRLPRRWKTRW